ncbi:hypothetical protein U9M48_030784, partial [Paspalum notatum var. saurae]
MSSVPLNISFRRGLYGERLNTWNELVGRVMNLVRREGRDKFIWGLNKTGVFTVRSMYKHLVNNGIKVSQEIWKTKIPLKTKIFMWYIKRGVLLTKDNLARRNWNGYQGCCFCNSNESIQHLFFDCHLAKGALSINPSSWRELRPCCGQFGCKEMTRFLTKQPKNFLRVLFGGTLRLRHRAKLQRNEDRTQWLTQGAHNLEVAALRIFNSFGWQNQGRIS